MADKQAVLFIHELGEKWPMDTLRGFVNSVWQTDSSVRERWQEGTIWSKPDKFSKTSEIRRLTTTQNSDGLRTDFFEFYWSPMAGRTGIGHWGTWLHQIAVRAPFGISRSLLGVWLIVWMLALPALALLVHQFLPSSLQLFNISWFTLIPLCLVLLLLPQWLLFPVLGNSIWYFSPRPKDIMRRKEIRAAGASLLRNMIDSGEYTRIMVVGHGMGSVIGYDILHDVWPDYNTRAVGSRHMALDWLQQTIKADPFDIDAYQEAQRDYCDELKANGSPWCVTDFVTLGSHLYRVPMLLARSLDAFFGKIAEREYPVAPPVEEGNGSGSRFTYERPLSGSQYVTRPIPHHGAVFAPVRWTNLYMPSRYLLFGDLISGPVAPVFGHGIRDVAVETRKKSGILSHQEYWTIENPKDPDNPGLSVRALRHHLQLAEGRQIVQVRDASSFETLVTDSPPVPNLTARVEAEIRKAVEAGAAKKETSASDKLVMALQKSQSETATMDRPGTDTVKDTEVIDADALEQAITEAISAEPADTEADTEEEPEEPNGGTEYFVYENPARDRVRIHSAACRYCQDVETVEEDTQSDNSARWHKFSDRAEALKIADSLARKDTRTCGVCNP
ncbi:MAG: hypothetical protein ABJN26_22975 [Stappiaceae bacterium]